MRAKQASKRREEKKSNGSINNEWRDTWGAWVIYIGMSSGGVG